MLPIYYKSYNKKIHQIKNRFISVLAHQIKIGLLNVPRAQQDDIFTTKAEKELEKNLISTNEEIIYKWSSLVRS